MDDGGYYKLKGMFSWLPLGKILAAHPYTHTTLMLKMDTGYSRQMEVVSRDVAVVSKRH